MIDRRALIFGTVVGLISQSATAAEVLPRSGGKTRVLSVANTYAKQKWPGPLPKTVADSRAFLKEAAKLPRSVVYPLDETNFDDLKGGIRSFLEQCRSNDTIVFHYCGHGVQVANQNFMVTDDGLSLVSLQSLLLRLRGDLERLPDDTLYGRSAVAFLNACRNNPMTERENGTAGLSVYYNFFGEPQSIDTSLGGDGFSQFELSKDDQTGMNILFSTALGNTARMSLKDETELQGKPDDPLTPFGEALVQHIGDQVNVQTLFARIAARVDLATAATTIGFRQTPHAQGANMKDIWLAGYPRMRPLPL